MEQNRSFCQPYTLRSCVRVELLRLEERALQQLCTSFSSPLAFMRVCQRERDRQFCSKVVVREVSTRLGRLHVGKRAGEAKRRGSDGGWQESCQEQADLPNYASKTCWRLSQVHTSPFLSHTRVTPLRPRLRAFDSSSRNAKRHPFPPTPNAWEGSPCPNSPLAFKFQGPHKKKVYSLQTMFRRNRVVEARISREAVPGDRVGDFVCFYLMTGRER